MKTLWLMMFMVACGSDPSGGNPAATPSPTPKPKPEPAGEVATKKQVVADPEPTAEPDPVEPTDWVDPVTGYQWLIVGAGDVDETACDEPAGFMFPDIFDIQAAHANGFVDLFDDWGWVTHVWTKNLSDGVVESWRDITDPTQWMNTLTDGFTVCVEVH